MTEVNIGSVRDIIKELDEAKYIDSNYARKYISMLGLDVSLRKLAIDIGVPVSTLSRFINGDELITSNFDKIIHFIVDRESRKGGDDVIL